MKYVTSTELQKRALEAGLKRSSAVVLGILGYWAQVPGGMKKDNGQPWKWRNYGEISDTSGYSTTTIQRAIKLLKSEQLIETKLMFNPSKPGETVNGFRLTAKGYNFLNLPMPNGTNADSGATSKAAAGEAKKAIRNVQNGESHQQDTFKKNQKENTLCSGKGKEEKNGQMASGDSNPQSEEIPATLEEVAAMLGYTYS